MNINTVIVSPKLVELESRVMLDYRGFTVCLC